MTQCIEVFALDDTKIIIWVNDIWAIEEIRNIGARIYISGGNFFVKHSVEQVWELIKLSEKKVNDAMQQTV